MDKSSSEEILIKRWSCQQHELWTRKRWPAMSHKWDPRLSYYDDGRTWRGLSALSRVNVEDEVRPNPSKRMNFDSCNGEWISTKVWCSMGSSWVVSG